MSYTLGQAVPLAYRVYDEDGNATSPATAVLTVTKPDGTTETPTITEDTDTIGLFELDYSPGSVGAYSAVFVTTGPNGADATAWMVVAGTAYVIQPVDVSAYLGDVTATNEQITLAIATEQAAQARRCRVDDYGPDLRGALLRRVARNLAAAQVPIAQFSSFDGVSTGARVTTLDPEIERLERPYLRWAVR